MNLHFVTWNKISAYKRLSFSLISSIYFIALPLKMQKRLTDQSKVDHTFLICLKRNNPQTLRSSSFKNPYLQCLCYWYYLLRWMFFNSWMFFNPCDNWKTILFIKVYRYSEVFLTAMLLLSLKSVFWKKFIFYVLSPQ